jgi:hypothetical protein
MKILQIPPEHPLRPTVSRLIRATYYLIYGARITALPKTLVALIDHSGKVLAAAGLRDASEPFFSEHYLDLPIEQFLSQVTRKPLDRKSVVEVSCLASRAPAISAQFMRELVLYGERLGYDWAFFTATSRLEKLLRRMRLPLLTLGEASMDRVPNPESWGSYYDTNPKVFAFGREHLKPFLVKWIGETPAFEARVHG